MKRYTPTLEELEAEWKRVQDYWDKLNHDSGMMDYPWTRARFNLAIFKSMLSQRGWRLPSDFGGPI